MDHAREVRDALLHLNDLPYLQTHPLARSVVGGGTVGALDRARALQQRLLKAVEGLKPEGEGPTAERPTRRHQLLTLRYVEGLDVPAVCHQLTISRAEYYRLHQEGMETVAGLLSPEKAEVPPGAADQSELIAGPELVYRRVFVGRQEQTVRLQQAFQRAEKGAGELVVVEGEPGIGKSALCHQIVAFATESGAAALMGRCYEQGSLSLPYLPFVEAIGDYVAGRGVEELKGRLGAGARDVARIVPELHERLKVELRPPGNPEEDRYRLFQAVTAFLRNAALSQPILLVLEDLHDADRGTLDLLVYLARHLVGARLLLVGTYRDVEVDRAHPLTSALAELRRGGAFTRIALRGLTAGEVHEMVHVVQGQDVRADFTAAVHRRTEGNPLFVQEVLRYLVEEGLVVWRGDHWEGRWRRTEEALPEAGIPGGLRDVIGKRFSRLSPSCAQLLGVASVIGRDFPLDVLLGVAGLSEEDVFAGLEEARDLALLEEISAPGALTYRFGHALFRQTLYEDLLAPRRLRLHQQVARALEEKYADRLEEHSAELAGHYAHSTDKDDLAKAITYFRMAATRDIGVYAYAEASEHLEQALAAQQALDSRDRSSRCDLLLALGEVLMPSGEPLRVAEELAEGAFSLAEALRDEERAAAACRLALNALNRYGAVSARSGTQWQKWAGRIDRYAPAGTVSRVYADLAVGSQWGAQGWARSLGALELARQLGEPEATFQCARQLLLGGRLTHWEESLALAEEFAVRP